MSFIYHVLLFRMVDLFSIIIRNIEIQLESTPITTIPFFHLFQFFSYIWNNHFIFLGIFSRNPKNDINATIKCQTKCHSFDFKMHLKLFMKFLQEWKSVKNIIHNKNFHPHSIVIFTSLTSSAMDHTLCKLHLHRKF